MATAYGVARDHISLEKLTSLTQRLCLGALGGALTALIYIPDADACGCLSPPVPMLFVASRLIPGADVSEIRPLRMRYLGAQPMIPLRLTAVAAEPHLTVTAHIFGDRYFQPDGSPLVNIDQSRLSEDLASRNNYPMVLSRAIDEQGGSGFVAEYMGEPRLPDFDRGTGCCESGFDICGIEFDGVCSCPGNAADALDCADETELLAGLALLAQFNTTVSDSGGSPAGGSPPAQTSSPKTLERYSQDVCAN